jgi:hypothetical protein
MFFSGEMIAEIVRHILRGGKKNACTFGKKNACTFGKKNDCTFGKKKRLHPWQARTLQLTNTIPKDENHIFFGL